MQFWRISNHADLSGRGGLVASGRWNHKGTAIIYTSDHPSTALLEVLVNADMSELPESYNLITIEIPDEIRPSTPNLPENWQQNQKTTRDTWQRFVENGTNPVLKVPGIITPYTHNFLLNPALAERSGIKIIQTERYRYDPRLID